MKNTRSANLSIRAFVFAAFFTAAPGFAGVLFDTGILTFSPTGTQTDRLLRDGTASTWGGSKSFPGVLGDQLQRDTEVFTVHVGNANFLQINLDDSKSALFDAAYATAFVPDSTAPFFGLDLGYLGDPGITQPFGNPSSFQIVVPRGSTIAIAINEIDPGGGASATFDLQVEAFVDDRFNDVPEPAALLLFASGLLCLMAVRPKVRN